MAFFAENIKRYKSGQPSPTPVDVEAGFLLLDAFHDDAYDAVEGLPGCLDVLKEAKLKHRFTFCAVRV